MTGEQWFQLWLTTAQVLIGATVTVVAIYIGARLAFSAYRKQSIETRSKQGAERLALGLQQSHKELTDFHLVLLLELSTISRADVWDDGGIVKEAIQRILTPTERVMPESIFLSSEALKSHVRWAFYQLAILRAMALLISGQPESVRRQELIDTVKESAAYINRVTESLQRYLLGEPLPSITEPDTPSVYRTREATGSSRRSDADAQQPRVPD